MKALRHALLGVLLASAALLAQAGLKEGEAAFARKDYGRALAQLRPVAEAGDAQAQYRLGLIHDLGLSVAVDPAGAARWFERAAAQGHAAAQYRLGLAYALGRGRERDDTLAAQWYRRAAEQGEREAQSELAAFYDAGRGVKRDAEEAARWYLKAAEQGLIRAQIALGVKYDAGHGVRQSYREAVKWFRRAAAQGDALAINNLGVMFADGLGYDVSRIAAWALYDFSMTRDPSPSNKAFENRRELLKRLTDAEGKAALALSRKLERSPDWLAELDRWCAANGVRVR